MSEKIIMNARIAFLFCLFPLMALGNMGCGRPVTFVVKDEQQRPIEEANILVVYQKGWMPGEGFGRDLYASQEKTTDKYGRAHFRVSPYGSPRFDYEVEDPKGRYHSSKRKEDMPLSKDGTTQIDVILRAKRNPIPLLYKLHYASLWIPKSHGKSVGHHEPLGYDVVEDDWVAPYGKGKIVDFIFRFRYESSGKYGGDYQKEYTTDAQGLPVYVGNHKAMSVFSLSFANEGDGIVEAPRLWPTSVIPVSREAPLEGYRPEIRQEWYWPNRKMNRLPPKGQQYFFRVRTQYDNEGKMIYALYGKITDGFLFSSLRLDEGGVDFRYALNPTPLDRNLEDDRKFGTRPNEQRNQRTHINADYIRRFPSVLLNQDDYLRSLPTLAEEERKKTSAHAKP